MATTAGRVLYSTQPSAEALTLQTELDRSSSRWNRLSMSSFPRLAQKLQNYNRSTQAPINIVGWGSSVGVSATLLNQADSPCDYFVYRMQQLFDPAGIYNWQSVNISVNGTTAASYPAASTNLAAMIQITRRVIASGGTGYVVGDILSDAGGTVTPIISRTYSGGQFRVTQVDGSGVIQLISPTVPGNNQSAGNYSVAPSSPNSPTGGTGTGASMTLTTAVITPTVALTVYGMNDGAPAQFNSGETFTGFNASMFSFANAQHLIGADVLFMTTPHPSVVTSASTVFLFPNSINMSYPFFVAMPVAQSQLDPPDPGVPGNGSIETDNFLGNSGPLVSAAHRYLRINQAMRDVAAACGAAVIDVERYWFEAIQIEMLLSGQTTQQAQQLYAESVLFNVSGLPVHPNLLGHQLSYHRAIDDAVSGLAQQSAQIINQALMNGYGGINLPGQSAGLVTSPIIPPAIWSIYAPYPDQTTPPLEVFARTGTADGSGIKANALAWKVDQSGNLVGFVQTFNNVPSIAAGSIIRFGNFGFKQFDLRYINFPSTAASATQVYTLPTSNDGSIKITGIQTGGGVQSWCADFIVSSAGVVAFSTPVQINGGTAGSGATLLTGGPQFNLSITGATITATAVNQIGLTIKVSTEI